MEPSYIYFFEETGLDVRVVLVSLERHKLSYAVRFGFKATNNAEEYEALLFDLRLTKGLQVKRLPNSGDAQLLISQVNGNFNAREKGMAAYLRLVIDLLPSFEKFELAQILRMENTCPCSIKLG